MLRQSARGSDKAVGRPMIFFVIPRCPACNVLIDVEDVNVAKDVALCRACQKVFSFAGLSKRTAGAELDAVDLSTPPRGMRLVQNATEVALIMSTRSLGMALFLVPFTAVWSGGSLTGIYGSQIRSGQFNIGLSLFGLPFLAGTMLLIPLTMMCVCGHMKISIRGDEGEVFTGVSFIGWRRRFRASEITDVYVEASKPDDEGDRTWAVVLERQNLERQHLERQTKAIRLMASSKAERRNFVAAVLRAWLGMAGRGSGKRAA